MDGLIFVGYQFSWFSWRVRSSTHEKVIFCMNYEGKCHDHEFWPHDYVTFAQTTGTLEYKAFHSNLPKMTNVWTQLAWNHSFIIWTTTVQKFIPIYQQIWILQIFPHFSRFYNRIVTILPPKIAIIGPILGKIA